jgi:capsule synthesis protein PGA_cap
MRNASAVIRSQIGWCATALLLLAGCTSATGGSPPAVPRPPDISRAQPGGAGGHPTLSSAAPSSTAPSSTAPRPRPSGRFTVAFAGDVHFMNQVGERLARDPATVFGAAAPGLRKADLTMVNLETAITTGGEQQPKEFTFRAPPVAFQALRDAGIDVATMANNHGADYGTPGLRDSLAAIAKYHFPVVGIGRDAAHAYAPYTTTLNGVRVAIIGADQVQDETTLSRFSAGAHSPGVANAYSDRLLASVRAAKRAGYLVIVYVHWGIEYQNCPSGDQQGLAATLSKAGAAAVVGAHAHVLQGAGWRSDGTYVAYGLGNYLWWRTFGNAQDDNGVLTLTFRHGKVVANSFVPSHLQPSGVSPPATGADRTRILAEWAQDRGCTDLSAHPPK